MDSLPPHARALLDAARHADDPTPEDRSRADAALNAALAREGVFDRPPLEASPRAEPISGSTGSASVEGAGRMAIKVVLGAGALLATALLTLVALPRGSAPAAERPPTTAAPDASATRVAAPKAPASNLATSPTTPERPRDERQMQSALDDDVEALQRPERAVRARSHAGPAQDRALEAEMALIASADESVRAHRYGEAKRLLVTYDRRFPHGALREERAALGVLALCADRPDAHAHQEAERFLRSFPRSMLAMRVRAACALAAQASP